LTAAQVKQRAENGARAGTRALILLSAPINVHVLDALAGGVRSLADLRRAAGSPPQTTMRGHLRTLTETGVIAKRRQNDFPGALDYELTAVGRELVLVTETLRSWLTASPERPLGLGSVAAKGAIKALVDGWGTCMLRALAAGPLSLTELDSLISSFNYPSLERRLGAMRSAGQVVAAPGRGRGTPYTVTDWLRRAVAPIAAAARWERQNVAPATAPITRLDAEAAFLLAVPLLGPAAELRGACRLAVEVPNGSGSRPAGVLVAVEGGRVTSCTARLEGHADAWISGSAPDWFRAVIEHDTARLDRGGERALTGAIVDGLHEVLFASRAANFP
jgi:DNA-binding HxlR family transcriptional regulator